MAYCKGARLKPYAGSGLVLGWPALRPGLAASADGILGRRMEGPVAHRLVLLGRESNVINGRGFRRLYSVNGSTNVPNVPMYLVLNTAIGGIGGGDPDPASFPQTFEVDSVRITQ